MSMEGFSQRRELRIQRIRENLREAKKNQNKVIKDAAELKGRLKRLDDAAEMRIRQQLAALGSPYLPIRPASAVPRVHPPLLTPPVVGYWSVSIKFPINSRGVLRLMGIVARQ